MKRRIPALRVFVHILIIIVQAGDVAELLDPRDGRGQAFVAAALGVGGQIIGVPAVVAPLGPAADGEQAPVDSQVGAQMLGNLRGLVERPVDPLPLNVRAILAHPPFQAGPELHVGGAEQAFLVGIAAIFWCSVTAVPFCSAIRR